MNAEDIPFAPDLEFTPREKPRVVTLDEFVAVDEPGAAPLVGDTENVLIPEIEGMFTVRTTRPVWDATGTVILIPQGSASGPRPSPPICCSGTNASRDLP